jgi:hypothetical protein
MGRPTLSPLQCGSFRCGRCRPRLRRADGPARAAGFTANKISADEKSKILQAARRAALRGTHGTHGTALCWIVCGNNAHCVGLYAATTHTVLDCMLQRRTLCGAHRRPCIQCLRLTVPKSCVDIAAWPRSGRPPVGGADGAGPPARPPTAHSIDDVGVACCAPRGACAAAPLPQ